MSIKISNLTDVTVPVWDAFVANCPSATFFHRAGWKTVLERAFGHKTHYLMAEEDGELVAILPLAELHSALFGHHLVSTPFCVYGGVAANSDAAADTLIDHACRLADALKVEDFELRNRSRCRPTWPEKDLYVTFRKAISADPDVNMKSIPRKQRAMVRKGVDAGLSGEIDSGSDRLYRIYAESVRNLGTPVFSKRYFEILRATFGDACDVLLIQHQGKDIAGVMSFYFRDEVLPYYGGSVTAARDVKGNDFMYWDLMCKASERGARVFDYGRSKIDTGPYSFKKNWGFEATPLHYEYHLVRANSIPKVDPTNPKYHTMIELWKRLPLPLANSLGPLLARNLG